MKVYKAKDKLDEQSAVLKKRIGYNERHNLLL